MHRTPSLSQLRSFQAESDDPAALAKECAHVMSGRVGKLLIASFVCPFLMFSVLEGGTKVMMFWSLLALGGFPMVVWTLAPLLGGVSALVCRRVLDGSALAGGMFVTGLVVLLSLSFLDLRDEGTLLGSPLNVYEQNWAFLLLVGAGISIAVGNRVRRDLGELKVVKGLLAVGGLVFCGLFFAPVVDGEAPIGFLISPSAWGVDFFGNLILLAIFGYGVVSLLAPVQLPIHEFGSRAIRVVHWIILIGFPALAVLGCTSNASGIEAAFTGGSTLNILVWAFKTFSLYYGAILLMASGASSWLTIRLWDQVAAPEAPPEPE